jgi:hypothetical protein
MTMTMIKMMETEHTPITSAPNNNQTIIATIRTTPKQNDSIETETAIKIEQQFKNVETTTATTILITRATQQ